MAKISMRGTGDIEQTALELIKRIKETGISCELVDSSYRDSNILLVFEKYYMRASNRASLSIMLTDDNGYLYVDIIASGGGQGALFSFSWGTEGDYVDSAKNVLECLGFSVIV